MNVPERTILAGRQGGRRAGPPKGRPVDPAAALEIAAPLRARSRDREPARDELIEALHALQDTFGHISARHLRALADAMRLSMAEVFEVATFYHHFDVVREDRPAPPPVTVRVCDGVACLVAGAEWLLETLSAAVGPDAVRVLRAPCMGRCAGAPAARVGDREVDGADAEGLLALADHALGAAGHAGHLSAHAAARAALPPVAPGYVALDAYREAGGYGLLARVRMG